MSTSNVWRKEVTNQPRFRGHGLRAVVRRAASGWSWKIMCESELVASGAAKTKRECREAVRAAKAKRLGKPAPEKPLAPRPSTRVTAAATTRSAAPTASLAGLEAEKGVKTAETACHAPEGTQ